MQYSHREMVVGGTTWHWVEAGSGECVVLLHGIPESWYCWHGQIPVLADQFRVLAIDLKGYGQSSKEDGDYSSTGVARELLALLDALGIERFRVVGHDWGSFIADRVCMQAPSRVVQYVRISASVHIYDSRNSLQHPRYQADPEAFARVLGGTNGLAAYVRAWFNSSCKPDTVPTGVEMDRIIEEFSYDGITKSVGRYFRDIRKNPPMDFGLLTFPVLVIVNEHDPRQPMSYFQGLEEVIPGLDGVLVMDSGHFVTHERPEEIALILLIYFNHLLAGDSRFFDRSRALGLPVRPKLAELAGPSGAKGMTG